MNPAEEDLVPPVSENRPRIVFVLSPGHCGGRRGRMLLRADAAFPLAVALRESGAGIGDVYSFVSGLYFRGKLAYGRAFGSAGEPPGVLVIVPGRGLLPPGTRVTRAELAAIAGIGVTPEDPRFAEPLARDAAALGAALGEAGRVVLLGSIATGKYVDLLAAPLGTRLQFPATFVGRGDMSRGGLLLRCVREGRELEYVPVAGAVRRGPRPPRLDPLPRSSRARGVVD